MFNNVKSVNVKADYQIMILSAKKFIEDETDIVALLSNLSALINNYVDDINWVGFYLLKGNELVLGPFQGKPACTRIPVGKGVCGKAVLVREPVIVPDVSQFQGHIACDSASVSELVIPIFKNGNVYGVLDIDSTRQNRFADLELEYLKQITGLLADFLNKH